MFSCKNTLQILGLRRDFLYVLIFGGKLLPPAKTKMACLSVSFTLKIPPNDVIKIFHMKYDRYLN